jgi:hypothetical protein
MALTFKNVKMHPELTADGREHPAGASLTMTEAEWLQSYNWARVVEGAWVPITPEAVALTAIAPTVLGTRKPTIGNLSPSTVETFISEYLDFKGLAVVFDGSNDESVNDLARWNSAVSESQSKRLPLFIPPGAHRLDDRAVYPAQDAAIFGVSAGQSRLLCDKGLRIGPDDGGGPFGGPGDMPRGYVRDLSIWGLSSGGVPIDHLPDNEPHTRFGLQLSKTNVDVERIDVRGFHVGFDKTGNCYGTRMASCWAKYGWNHIGMLIRTGDQDGQDHTYDNCWFSGRKSGVMIEPYTAAQHFRGGQIGAGASNTTADQDNYGALMIGMSHQYFVDGTFSPGGVRNIDFVGTNFEGSDRCWQVRMWEPSYSVLFQACHFMGHGGNTAPGGDAIAQGPLGLLKWWNPYTGNIAFRDCFVARYYKGVNYDGLGTIYGPQLVIYDGVQNNALQVIEDNTTLSGDLRVNGPSVPYVSSGKVAQGFDMRGVWANDGVVHSGNGRYGEVQLGGLRLRGSANGNFEKSTNYGANWSAV